MLEEVGFQDIGDNDLTKMRIIYLHETTGDSMYMLCYDFYSHKSSSITPMFKKNGKILSLSEWKGELKMIHQSVLSKNSNK